jgi:hypothetical protein
MRAANKACDHRMCFKELAVEGGVKKIVSANTETRWSYN